MRRMRWCPVSWMWTTWLGSSTCLPRPWGSLSSPLSLSISSTGGLDTASLGSALANLVFFSPSVGWEHVYICRGCILAYVGMFYMDSSFVVWEIKTTDWNKQIEFVPSKLIKAGHWLCAAYSKWICGCVIIWTWGSFSGTTVVVCKALRVSEVLYLLGTNAALLGSDRSLLVLFYISKVKEQSKHKHMQRTRASPKLRNRETKQKSKYEREGWEWRWEGESRGSLGYWQK